MNIKKFSAPIRPHKNTISLMATLLMIRALPWLLMLSDYQYTLNHHGGIWVDWGEGNACDVWNNNALLHLIKTIGCIEN